MSILPFGLRQTKPLSNEELQLRLLQQLHDIRKKLATDNNNSFSFKELADQQEAIIKALEGSDPPLNKAAQELFS